MKFGWAAHFPLDSVIESFVFGLQTGSSGGHSLCFIVVIGVHVKRVK